MSSGPIIPARAPSSIDMLQIVSRPSIESERTASPAYSTTWPTASSHADLPDRAEDHVLRRQAVRQLPGEFDQHRSGPLLCQRLGRQYVLDLGRPDADGERTESPVGGRVRIPADDRRAGLGEAELGADHVHDALAARPGRMQLDAELRAVGAERFELLPRHLVLDAARQSRDGVIHRRHGALGPADATTGEPKPLEGLGRGDLVHEVEVDVEKGDAVLVHVDDVVVPHLLEQCPAHLERLPRSGRSSREQAVYECFSRRMPGGRPHRRTRVRRLAPGQSRPPRCPKTHPTLNKELHMRTLIAVTVTIWIVVLAAAAVG